MIDDTPSKLRAQPFTLIDTPSFTYPLEPSRQTARSMLDCFLVQLVGMLDVMSTETNFANYMMHERWFESAGGRDAEFVQRGIAVLKNAGVPIDATGRGPIAIPSVPSMSRRAVGEFRRFKTSPEPVRYQPVTSSPAVFFFAASTVSVQVLRLRQLIIPVTEPTTRQTRPPPSDVSTDTDTDIDTDTDDDDRLQAGDASVSTDSSLDTVSEGQVIHRSHRWQPDLSTDQPPRFVREMEALSNGRSRTVTGRRRLNDAVRDWENMESRPFPRAR